MKVTLGRPYKSIDSLEAVDLPEFTMITGLNGSGKTQLLEAIKDSHVIVSRGEGNSQSLPSSSRGPERPPRRDQPAPPLPILHNFSMITADTWKPYARQEYDLLKGEVKKAHAKYVEAVAHQLQQELEAELPRPAREIAALDLSQVSAAVQEETVASRVVTIMRETDARIRSQLRGAGAGSALVWRNDVTLKEPLFPRGADGGMDYLRPRHALFAPAFAQMIAAYRNAKFRNELSAFRASQDIKAAKDSFEQRFGPSPWEVINDMLSEVGLDISIREPDATDYDGGYVPELKKASTGATIRPGDLSSGEKVIFGLLLAEYLARREEPLEKVRVVLLDEVDAPLHPRLASQYLRLLEQVLVGKLGATVIATTHSPSTIALSPESSIHVLEDQGGKKLIRKVSKNVALRVLTVGVPTLSIDFEGRRQVFCESETDRAVYSRMYQRLALKHDRSLEFIAAGHSRDGGCDRVIDVVTQLATAGNKSVMGLIDWDGGLQDKRLSSRIHICSPLRKGLENLVFDPLLLLAAVQMANRDDLVKVGLKRELSVEGLKTLPKIDLQKSVEMVEKLVLPSADHDQKQEIGYCGGFGLSISKSYLGYHDHDLEDAVLAAFPRLKSKANNRKLQLFVADDVGIEYSEFVPTEVQDAFVRLLNAEF